MQRAARGRRARDEEDANVSCGALQVAAREVVVSGARDRLRQVFANLLDNAIKYTPEGGSVTLRTSADDRTAVVTVADTGVGIGAEHLPRIWERLYRADASRSTRGLGLGLSLVKAYVQAHGGTVEADSEPGRGSVFTVRLPILTPM